MVLGHDLGTGQRTQDIRVSEDVSFDTMLLKKATLKGLNNAGFLRPSPIQLHAIPLGKCGFDLLLEAKSGTGKTAVFTIISLEKLDLSMGVQTIILAPTREIAYQISDVITEIGSHYKGLNVAVVMGGLPVKDDIKKFSENVHIVVGSPGRLRHLIQDKHVNLSAVRLFILDEADKLLEQSFLPDINYIFSVLPKQKQVIMSSATYSEEIKSFIGKYVKKSQHICPDSSSVLLGISQKVTIVPYNSNIVKQTQHRYTELKKILNSKQFKQCLIFCNYQVRVSELHRMLSRDKWPAEQLYGKQDQTHRLDALKTLQEYKCRILVSTDLAARGIDASNVDIVINFEPPSEWQTYLHRIGRAGRYGSYGTAISILSEGIEKKKFKKMLALTNIPFELHELWIDEQFNLTSTDVTTEKDEAPATIAPNNTILENGDKSKDMLWKALTTESIETQDIHPEVPNFNELCDSFKLSNESTIETFPDLMQSFEVSQNKNNNSENSEFKHVKVAKLLPIGIKYLVNLGISNISQANSLSNNEIKMKKQSTNNISSRKNGDFINQKELNGNERYLTEDMEKEMLNHKKSNNEDVKLDMTTEDDQAKKDTRKKSNDFGIDNSKHIDMGLPTAFGKSKQVSYKTDAYRNIGKYLHNNNKNNSNSTNLIKQAILDANFANGFGVKSGENYDKINDYELNKKENEINQNEQVLEANGLETMKQGSYNHIRRNHNSNYHNHERISDDNLDMEPIKQALMDAGLPTAFGKKQNKHINYKYKERTTKEKPKEKEDNQTPLKIQEIHRRDLKDIYSSKTFTRYCYKQKYSSPTVVESDQADSYSEKCFNNKTNFKSEKYCASTYKKSCHQTKNCSSTQQLREKQFDNWYNHLKHQTQAIQYALYIEEMRN